MLKPEIMKCKEGHELSCKSLRSFRKSTSSGTSEDVDATNVHATERSIWAAAVRCPLALRKSYGFEHILNIEYRRMIDSIGGCKVGSSPPRKGSNICHSQLGELQHVTEAEFGRDVQSTTEKHVIFAS